MAEEKMTLEDWLDDLCVRFIVNLGKADLSDTARICFQIEEAQWFYEDFIRPLDPQLPSMTLKQFSLKIFQHCPLFAGFSAENHQLAFERFLLYKTRVPVRGAIMLNAAMDSAVLVRGYKKGASWSFPRGKINKDEDDLDCAVREVIEETGFDLRLAGLVDRNTPVTPVEVTMKDQQVRLYVFRDVPEDTAFAPRTRKEIGAIQWYKLNDLPTYKKKKGKNTDATSADRFYMVAPFMVQLRNWIKQQRKDRPLPIAQDDGLTDDNVFYPHASAGDENVNDVTKGLQDLLHHTPQAPPQSQGNSNQDAAAAHLMALLQPGLASGFSTSQTQPQTQPHVQQQDHERQQQYQYELQQQELHNKQHMQQLQLQQHHLQQQIHQREQQQRQQQYQQYHKQGQESQQFAKQQYLQQQYPPAQREYGVTEAPQPQSPHHHHQTQRVQQSDYSQSPPSVNFAAPGSDYSQYRNQRPQVQAPSLAQQQIAPAHFQSQPVQLVHPQPMPAPQVVSAMVNNYGNEYNQPTDKGPEPAQQQPSGFGTQAQSSNLLQQQNRAQPPAQMPTHSMNLLNALMGGGGAQSQQPAVQQNAAPGLYQQPAQYQEGARLKTLQPQPTSDYAPQVISGPDTKTYGLAQQSPAAKPQSMNKHHSNLLGMFKVGSQGALLSQPVDKVTVRQHPSQTEKLRQLDQPIQELPTMADAMKTAAREKGRPLQMSSETNLPYGAITILARPQPDHKPNAVEMPSKELPVKELPVKETFAQPQSPLRPIREPRIGSRDSSGFPSARTSPRHIQTQSQRNIAPAQLSPQGHLGKLQPGHGQSPRARMQNKVSDITRSKSPLSQVYSPTVPLDGMTRSTHMLPTPPSTSQLPLPGMGGTARRESTAEHKQSLLSLFGGQPKSGHEAGHVKGKDHATPEMYGAGAPPRSRVASVASSTGVGLTGTDGSRRGSQSPMSSSDRNFLLGFLHTASNKAM